MFPRGGLPHTARQDPDWWANDYRHPEKGAYGWLNANYEVVQVNLGKEYVVFNKLVKSKLVNLAFCEKQPEKKVRQVILCAFFLFSKTKRCFKIKKT